MPLFQPSRAWRGARTPVRLDTHLVNRPISTLAQGAMNWRLIHTADFAKYRTAAINNATSTFQKAGKQPGKLLGHYRRRDSWRKEDYQGGPSGYKYMHIMLRMSVRIYYFVETRISLKKDKLLRVFCQAEL